MTEIRFVLVTDGPSDRALMPILAWLLHRLASNVPVTPQHVDFRRLTDPPRDLAGKIAYALDAFPSDLLFVHRDAERQDPGNRVAEIDEAFARLPTSIQERLVEPVRVVPVRMTEAWLLFDEPALRRASGNPNGKVRLDLPRIKEVESIPDPKQRLRELLVQASELTGRRRKQFDAVQATFRLADLLGDFSPLLDLPAFQALRVDLERALGHWPGIKNPSSRRRDG